MAPTRTTAELAILSTIIKFTKGIRTSSAPLLKSLIVPDGSVTRAHAYPSGPITFSLSHLVSYISSKENMEGRFDPDEAVIIFDGDLAVVWTKWTSFTDGVKNHEGRIVFVLMKTKGTDTERESGNVVAVPEEADTDWKIVGNADNLVAV